MWYTIAEIAILLVLAVLLGLLVGWLLWKWGKVSMSRRDRDDLVSERDQLRDEHTALSGELDDVSHELTTIRREHDRAESVIAGKQVELKDVRDRERVLVQERDQLRSRLANAGTDAAGTAAVGGAATRVSRETPRYADDLTAIRGIGPDMERFLHGRGITTFTALARLSPAEIDALQEQLPEFPGRIRNDEWVGQARRMIDERARDNKWRST